MDDKKIIRIAVSPEAKAVIETWADLRDMTEIGVASRIYEWFGRQPEELQRGILGLYGKHGPNLARRALQLMMEDQPNTQFQFPPPPDNAGGSPADPKGPVFPKPDDAIYNIRRTAATTHRGSGVSMQ